MSLMGKFTKAVKNGEKKVIVWGTGKPMREFLHIDDFTAAAVFLMDKFDDNAIINVGSGEEISVKELARLVADIAGFKGEIEFDKTKPDGSPQKLLDSKIINQLGWKARILLKDGLCNIFEGLTA